MNFGGNAAWEIPQEPTKQPTRKEKIRELEHKQIHGEMGSYTEGDRLELLRLREEEALENGEVMMTKEQKETYAKLFQRVKEACELRQKQRLEYLEKFGKSDDEYRERFIDTIDPDGIYGLSEFEREEYRHLLKLVENGGLREK